MPMKMKALICVVLHLISGIIYNFILKCFHKI